MSLPESPGAPASIQEKIRTAQCLFDTWKIALLQDSRIARLLKDTNEKAASSQRAMRNMGVVAACRGCEEEDGGSCCGAGIENKYNVVLLLLNLLSGAALPDRRLWADSCYFLGQSGCILKVRDVLCINYLCLKIQRMLEMDDLIRLQNTTGEEMDAIFLLHEAVKKYMDHKR